MRYRVPSQRKKRYAVSADTASDPIPKLSGEGGSKLTYRLAPTTNAYVAEQRGWKLSVCHRPGTSGLGFKRIGMSGVKGSG